MILVIKTQYMYVPWLNLLPMMLLITWCKKIPNFKFYISEYLYTLLHTFNLIWESRCALHCWCYMLKVNSVTQIAAFCVLPVHCCYCLLFCPSHIFKVISLKTENGEWSGFFGKVKLLHSERQTYKSRIQPQRPQLPVKCFTASEVV
jgi:hypothetical protein